MMDQRDDDNPADRSRVDLGKPSEIEHWTKQWNVSEEQLRKAVAEVGDDVPAVATFLSMTTKK